MKQELLNGITIEYDNQNGELLEAFHSNEKEGNQWATGFKIVLNGVMIGSFKTFHAFERNLNRIIVDRKMRKREDLD